MTERLLAQPLRKREDPLPASETPTQPETEQVRILVVEDNPKMAGALAAGLREQSYSVDVFSGGFEGEEAAASNSYDAIILDLMLPASGRA
jgi:CheY-like chemotaxis protein